MSVPKDVTHIRTTLALAALGAWTILTYAPLIGLPLMFATWLLERWTRAR